MHVRLDVLDMNQLYETIALKVVGKWTDIDVTGICIDCGE